MGFFLVIAWLSERCVACTTKKLNYFLLLYVICGEPSPGGGAAPVFQEKKRNHTVYLLVRIIDVVDLHR